jgi:hypothetical protein
MSEQHIFSQTVGGGCVDAATLGSIIADLVINVLFLNDH